LDPAALAVAAIAAALPYVVALAKEAAKSAAGGAQLVGWVKASDAGRAVKQVAKEFGKDAKRLIAVRRR